MIIINGKGFDLPPETPLYETLKEVGYAPEKVVCELNGAIVKKDDYSLVTLKDNDRLEVVTFVGGG